MKLFYRASLSRAALWGALLFFWTSEAFAGPGYTKPAPMTVLNPREYSVDIYAPLADNPMNCSNVGWFRIKTDASNYNSIISFILTRYANQAQISFYVPQCDASDGSSLIVASRNN